jgi:hypothetical protein
MSKYAILILTGALVVVAGCAKKAPLTPATPWADIRDDALCFLTTSTDPSGLKVQYVFDWGNGDTTATGLYKSGDTACCARSFPDTGTFHIKVKARNEAGRVSKWSDECLFHASRPPQLADTIVGFTRWAVDRWYRPSVKVTDPDGDSVSVKFIWSDSLASGWSQFVASGSTVTDSVKWQTTGRHVIHVLLKDKGSMVNSSAGAKIINLSTVAVLWYTPDSEELGSEGASPAMGQLDGEPVLYVAATGRVVCFGLDGSIKWTTDVGWGWDFAPSLSNDGSRLYLADDLNGLFCLDARTGCVLWSADISFDSPGTLAAGPDGALYAPAIEPFSDTACVIRVRDCGDSAHVEWRVPFPIVTPNPRRGAAIDADGTIYACCANPNERGGAIVALDANGSVLWQDTTHIEGSCWLYAPVIDSRGRVILGDDDGNLHCFNADGTIAWSTYAGAGLYGGGITVGYDDRIYFQSEDDRLYCYDSDGRQVWAEDIPNDTYSSSSPCALSDSTVLICSSEYGQVTCFSWEGNVLWTFSIEDSVEEARRTRARRDEGDEDTSPLIGPDGNVYLAGYYSTYCLAIGNVRLANTAWPTYNHDNARSGWAGRPQR